MSENDELLVKKYEAWLAVPYELLMDLGVIPDTREHKPVPRRTRFRWWRQAQRERFAAWLYRRVSGQDLPGGDDW